MAGRWFSPRTPVSSINKTDCHVITLAIKVALNTNTHSPNHLFIYLLNVVIASLIWINRDWDVALVIKHNWHNWLLFFKNKFINISLSVLLFIIYILCNNIIFITEPDSISVSADAAVDIRNESWRKMKLNRVDGKEISLEIVIQYKNGWNLLPIWY